MSAIEKNLLEIGVFNFLCYSVVINSIQADLLYNKRDEIVFSSENSCDCRTTLSISQKKTYKSFVSFNWMLVWMGYGRNLTLDL